MDIRWPRDGDAPGTVVTTTSTSTTVATGTASGALSAAESGNFVERRNQGDFRVGAAVVGLTLLAALIGPMMKSKVKK
ncbi:MAG: hypothetical protein R2715_18185 [Ilumatobacteraceae bacterium]